MTNTKFLTTAVLITALKMTIHVPKTTNSKKILMIPEEGSGFHV